MLERLWNEGSWIVLGFYFFLFLLSLAKGAAPERICAGILLIIPFIDQLHHQALGGSIIYREVDLGHMLIDVLVFCSLLTVALHANRVYPLWLGAAQIIAVITHFYRMSLPDIDQFAYQEMQVMSAYIQIAAITLGLWCHVARRKRHGSYPSWRRTAAAEPAAGWDMPAS
ncbi:MAG TPA: hypothetical protein VJQ77_11495 [Novosphingobium sp.]|nr:hypothetical protein [Novosphingobium sp.]